MVELKGYGVKIERHVDDLCTLIEEDVVSSGEVWIGKYYVGMLRDIGASILRCRGDLGSLETSFPYCAGGATP